MNGASRFCGTGLAAALLLSACGTLSGGGPSVKTLQSSPSVDVVNVTPALAASLADALDASNSAAIAHALQILRPSSNVPAVLFGPGSQMSVTIWSFSPRPGAAAGPQPTPLGAFTVTANGTILLPYLGEVKVAGLDLQQAQSELTRRYASLGLFQKPSVSIEANEIPQGRILVTGSIGQPKVIPWPPQGITLAEALTESLGNGADLLAQDNDARGHSEAISVRVFRAYGPSTSLPISVALEQNIPLRPDDRIIVKKAPAVEVTVLGPGMQGNGVFDFAHVPTLSEALARGAGLNANAANDHAVFVMRERTGTRPVLYDFAWNKAQGLVASHRFPLQSGDLVYVAEAPIVSVQRVINILFQATLPVQVAK